MMIFEPMAILQISGRGTVLVVKNPIDCTDFNWLLKQVIEAGGQRYFVRAVEFRRYDETVRQGEQLGLLVRKVEHE